MKMKVLFVSSILALLFTVATQASPIKTDQVIYSCVPQVPWIPGCWLK